MQILPVYIKVRKTKTHNQRPGEMINSACNHKRAELHRVPDQLPFLLLFNKNGLFRLYLKLPPKLTSDLLPVKHMYRDSVSTWLKGTQSCIQTYSQSYNVIV
ncbi:hypothetical protein ILYODFUR_002194 [Ilyodon furcidens]|uniref:Uncharacterized protein n=1 Tax=Ilyodon furcidens TaxID=33524 RepID=A0ABV0STJ3_9TELE